MGNMFRSDSKLYQIVEKIINLVKLNLIWILFCIPIVTIGAANTALHKVALQILDGEEGYIIPAFYREFCRNWKQKTKVWLLFLLIGAGIYVDMIFWQQVGGMMADVMKGFVLVLVILYLFLSIYLYPLMVHMSTGGKMTVRNAALLAFKYLPKTIYMVVWLGIVWMIGKLWAIGLLVQLLTGGSFLALLHAVVLKKIFQKENIMDEYSMKETEKEEAEQN